MSSRNHLARAARLLACIALLALSETLSGCIFYIDHLVPTHANAGDRVALRNPDGIDPLPDNLQVLFGTTPSRTILRRDPEEIVAEIPPGVAGDVKVSVWQGVYLASNIRPFHVDAEPIVYRIIAYGDSLVGPWVYHSDMLDTMLNADVGPSLVINEGKAGETLAEGASRLGDVLSIHSGVGYIYILEGANDVKDTHNTPLSEMLASLDQMVDLADSYSLVPILLTVPPRTRSAVFDDQTWPTTEDWNNVLRNYAVFNHITCVDLHQAFVDQPDWESFLDDYGLHLTLEGQHFVADVLYAAIVPLLE